MPNTSVERYFIYTTEIYSSSDYFNHILYVFKLSTDICLALLSRSVLFRWYIEKKHNPRIASCFFWRRKGLREREDNLINLNKQPPCRIDFSVQAVWLMVAVLVLDRIESDKCQGNEWITYKHIQRAIRSRRPSNVFNLAYISICAVNAVPWRVYPNHVDPNHIKHAAIWCAINI